jgi:hypothetical protein
MKRSRKVKSGQLSQAPRQIGRVGWRPVSIIYRFEFGTSPRPLGNRTQEIGSTRTKNKSGADDDCAGVRQLSPVLPLELRDAVNALRVGLVSLSIETLFLAIEDVIRRNCHQHRTYLTTRIREVFRSACVGCKSSLFVLLATINISPRGTIDDRIRPVVRKCLHHAIGIADIKGLVIV